MFLSDAQGQNIPVRITDNKDATFRVEFEAPVAGLYSANVTFASVATPGSPFRITVEDAVDASKAQVRGLPHSKYITYALQTRCLDPKRVSKHYSHSHINAFSFYTCKF